MPPSSPAAPAAPSVRRMARELGVDIDQVSGSGADGRISVEDVKAHAKRTHRGARAAAQARRHCRRAAAGLLAAGARSSVSRCARVRRKTAEHLSAAWATIPHVTQHDYADITGLEELRKRYAKQVEAAGGNLTVTAIAVKVVAAALKVFPQFNASIDLAPSEIISEEVRATSASPWTPIAACSCRSSATPTRRTSCRSSVELAQLSEKARTRKIALDEMQGGCFSISNLGGIGGSFFTPIVNAPEVAILGISRARMEPVYNKETGQFVPRSCCRCRCRTTTA